MRRLLPFPALSVAIFLIWLALWQSASVAALLGGAVLGATLPRTLLLLGWKPVTAKRPLVAVRLFFVVMHDIVESNINVARIVLTGKEREAPTGFVRIPLDLVHPYGLAILSIIITATPGTFWAAYDRRGSAVTIHTFGYAEPDSVRAAIQERYARPLTEIFQ